jgi:acyl-coenzyme A thioesterase PaaI-like protein
MSGALYEDIGGGRVRATELTRGPWDPGAQHGGAPSALLGHAVEAVEPGADMRTVRVTLELLRPVPIGELRVDTEIVRPGRRVQLVAACLRDVAGDAPVMRALALRIRRAEGVAPEVAATDALPAVPGPEATRTLPYGEGPTFANEGVELRPADGAVWIRLRVPILAGAPPSPLERALAAADFGNGVSSVLDWNAHVFINPDLSVHLERDAEGDWIALVAETTIGADGTGQSFSTLYDERGRIGRAVQSLFVDRR